MTSPDPSNVNDLSSLASEIDRLRVRAARGTARRKVSIADLARDLARALDSGVSKSTLHSYVSGRTLPPAEVLDQIVIALGATDDEQAAWGEAWYRVYETAHGVVRTLPGDVDGAAGSAEGVLGELHRRVILRRHKPFDVLAVSAQNMDEVRRVSVIAPDHETVVREPPIHCCGGSGANTAYALARLGHSVSVVGIVGADSYGGRLRSDLQGAGADLTMLLTAKTGMGTTGYTLVFTDREGQRLIYVHPGVNEKLAETLATEGLDAEDLAAAAANARIVHLSSFTGAGERRLQEELVEKLDDDAILSLNPGQIYSALGADRIAALLKRANVVFLYEKQLDSLFENSSLGVIYSPTRMTEKVSALFEWRAQRGSKQPLALIVKRPAELHQGTNQDYLSVGYGVSSMRDLRGPDARPIHDHVVDSTGAGDSLAAGFLSSILSCRPPRDSENFAYVMALSASSGLGARATLPTREDLLSCWKAHLPDVPPPNRLTLSSRS